MSKQLIQLCLPGPASSVHATFIDPASTLAQLVEQIVAEDGQQIRRVVCGRVPGDAEEDLGSWRIQRVLKSPPNCEWNDEELAAMGDGLLPPETTIEEALAAAGYETPSPHDSPRPDLGQRQFSDFVLTGHLHTPSLRLCFLPSSADVSFEHIPGFPEGWQYRLFLSAEMSAIETVEAIVEELSVRKVVVQGHKTARVEYVVQVRDAQGVPQVLPAPTRLLPYLQKLFPDITTPYQITFTVSPSWLRKAGTVAYAITSGGNSSTSTGGSSAKPRIASREGGGWRPSSLFGGFWGPEGKKEEPVPEEPPPDPEDDEDVEGQRTEPQEDDDEDEEEGERTIKGEKGSNPDPVPSTSTAMPLPLPATSRTRLSTLFTDWIAPEPSTSSSPSSPSPALEARTRIVGGPMPLSRDLGRRFSSFTPGERLSGIHNQGSFAENDENDEGEGEEDMDAALEGLMDDLGMKETQRLGMRQLPDDRKRFLLRQHRDSQARSSEPLRAAKTGPTGDNGLLSSVKRFSLASVGWGAASVNVSQAPLRPVTTFGTASDSSPHAPSPTSPSFRPVSPPLHAQPTGTSSSWTSWWSSASNATGTGQAASEQAKDTPPFYVDQLRSTKISQRSLVKHLIALRVRLSTAKLGWTQIFLGEAKGLDAVEGLLARIVLKRINKGEAPSEEDKTVQAECIKCLRVLLNTDIGFAQVLAHSNLITYIVFSLYTTSNKLRALVADVLAALCVLSLDNGHRIVLAAFSDARVAYDEKFRFEYLVDSLAVKDVQRDGEDDEHPHEEEDETGLWEYRTAAMSFVNAIANSPNELEERMMLREEFARRGLNEAMTGLRYVNPPEYCLTQLTVYAEERQEDQEELHERTVGMARDDTSDVPLSDLIRLAQEHEALHPKLVDTVKKYIKVFERKDMDDRLRDDLITVLDNFVEHASHLEDFDQGWRGFMRQYLSSVQHIVGQQSIVRASRIADTATVPTAFLEELETLRTKVDELSEERTTLRAELNEQIAEVSVLRGLPVERDVERGERLTRSSSLKKGDKDNFAGVIQQLVQKNREVIELQAKLTAQPAAPDEADAKEERARQNRRWESLIQEIGQYKVKIATLETEIEGRDKEIKYLKRTLESVYSRFQSTVATAVSGPPQLPRTPTASDPALDAELMANRTIEALAQREAEIAALKAELAKAKEETVKAQKVQLRHLIRLLLPHLPRHRHPQHLPHLRSPLRLRHLVKFLKLLTPQSLHCLLSAVELLFLHHLLHHHLPLPPQSRSSRSPLALRRRRRHRQRLELPVFPRRHQRLELPPFFWNKLPPTRVGPSVWAENDIAPLELVDLEKEFEIGAPLIRTVQTDNKLKKKKEVSTLLGMTRAQNIAIMLARIRLSHAAIRDAILLIDDAKLSVDSLKAIKHHAPNLDEIETLRSFDGDLSTLAVADQYFSEIIVFPRLSERLSCMLYRRRLEIDMEELKPDLTILRAAADELKQSAKFKKLLQTVLAIGNALNASTFRGGAAGFSLDSLLKLKETKAASASPSTPTLLHYLVRVVHRNDPSLVHFLDEAPHVDAASRISTVTVMQTVQSLVAGVAQAKEELALLKSLEVSPPGDQFLPVMERFVRHATPAMQALEKHGQTLDVDLRNLVLYFGEDPAQTKAEELFDLVAQFSSSLLRAELEVKAADAKAEAAAAKASQATLAPLAAKEVPPQTPPPGKPQSGTLSPANAGSFGRGHFDSAIRDLRNGVSSRRQRSTAERDRPLSRIFLSA
ncbi:hypothetical protein JCM5296_003653 [Sporobolomyces johnsonii]